MSDNKTFQVAFLVSILVHSVFFLGLPHMSFLPSKRSLENIEITYYKILEKPKEEKEITQKKKEPIVNGLPKISKEEILNPPEPRTKTNKEDELKPKSTTVAKHVEEKKFETMVREEEDDIKRATYISYYQAVRERIKLCADRNYPRDRSLSEGEIFLSFVVASNGELLKVMVVDERSTDDSFLKNIAIRSIRDASPFPPFPEGMNLYEIAFNVIISFELK